MVHLLSTSTTHQSIVLPDIVWFEIREISTNGKGFIHTLENFVNNSLELLSTASIGEVINRFRGYKDGIIFIARPNCQAEFATECEYRNLEQHTVAVTNLHHFWVKVMYDGTKCQAISPRRCHVGELHVGISFNTFLTPF